MKSGTPRASLPAIERATWPAWTVAALVLVLSLSIGATGMAKVARATRA